MFKLHPQLEKDCFVVGDFPLSRLLLMNDSQYPWFILVPRRADIREIYELELTSQQRLLAESSFLARSLMQCYQGDKLNIGALGNMVPQLHLHHIVRHQTDPCWPQPIWGAKPAIPYSLKERQARLELLLPLLSRELKEASY